MSLTIKPVTPAVGAEISGVDLARLSDAEYAQIEPAWRAALPRPDAHRR
jgi:alpha-ketoglutarate-dependent taurine dioxygenase